MKNLSSSPLGAEQMALVLGISETTVRKLAKAKELPCRFINSRPTFDLPEVLKHFGRLEEADA